MKSPSGCHSKMRELLVDYHHQPTLERRNQLLRLNAGLVRKMVLTAVRQGTQSYDSLEPVGYAGLINAIEAYDPHCQRAFSIFAASHIRQELKAAQCQPVTSDFFPFLSKVS